MNGSCILRTARPFAPADLWWHTLRHLAQSVRRYDAGDPLQALPIAFALRAMFHDTTEAKSLLKRMGAWRTARLISCTGSKPELLPPRLWWRGVMLDTAGLRYTRRMIVLEVANGCTRRNGLVGGTPRFERSSKGFYWIQTSFGDTAILRDYHFEGLLRAAREVLESPPAFMHASEYAVRDVV